MSLRDVPLPTVAQQITTATKPKPGQWWSSAEALPPTSGLPDAAAVQKPNLWILSDWGRRSAQKQAFPPATRSMDASARLPVNRVQGRGPDPVKIGPDKKQGRRIAPTVASPETSVSSSSSFTSSQPARRQGYRSFRSMTDVQFYYGGGPPKTQSTLSMR